METIKKTPRSGDAEHILVRVRRRAEAEPLESIELSFDSLNQLKRKRLVTQSTALASQFSAMMTSEESTPSKPITEKPTSGKLAEEETKSVAFSLGVHDKTATNDLQKERNVTLRRLMPDTHGKTLDEIKRQH